VARTGGAVAPNDRSPGPIDFALRSSDSKWPASRMPSIWCPMAYVCLCPFFAVNPRTLFICILILEHIFRLGKERCEHQGFLRTRKPRSGVAVVRFRSPIVGFCVGLYPVTSDSVNYSAIPCSAGRMNSARLVE
jgi:hypothetical protein